MNKGFPRYSRWIAVLLPMFVACVGRGDEVTVMDKRGNMRVQTGRVIDFVGGKLTLDRSGRTVTIPSETIKALSADWSDQHRSADAAYVQLRYAQALDDYRSAFRGESRRWVKRRILARVIRCQANTGKLVDACRNFSRLTADDPQSHHFNAIPLAWNDRPPPSGVGGLTKPWLESGTPAEQLMACSWLLLQAGKQKSVARQLRELGRYSWEPISKLAVSQLWRLELRGMRVDRVAWWEQHLESMPLDFRAGSYFLMGRTYEQHGTPDQIALSYLRVPTLYPHDAISNAALFRCGDSLQKFGQSDEARRCFEQLIERQSDYAERAKERLRVLRDSN